MICIFFQRSKQLYEACILYKGACFCWSFMLHMVETKWNAEVGMNIMIQIKVKNRPHVNAFDSHGNLKIRLCCLFLWILQIRQKFVYKELTCSGTLGIVVISNLHINVTSYIFWKKKKKTICMNVCYGDCFTSLIRKYLAELGK